MGTDCGCGAYGYDDCDDVATLTRTARVKTRKPHRCCECGGVIEKGSTVCMLTCLYDGSWETLYRCRACSALAELVADKNKSCPLWGVLRDTAIDSGFDWDALIGRPREEGRAAPAPQGEKP